jgi:hypothetical protein
MTNDPKQNPPTARSKKLNVIYFLVDNLGMGELSSYNAVLYAVLRLRASMPLPNKA